MADLSLHYTSKAPLAGTFTAFNQIFATWRRRAKERRELSTLDSRTLRDLGLSASDINFEVNKPFWRSLTRTRIRSRPVCYPARALPSPDTGRRSILSLPVDRRLFLCPRIADRAPDRAIPAAMLLWRHDSGNFSGNS